MSVFFSQSGRELLKVKFIVANYHEVVESRVNSEEESRQRFLTRYLLSVKALVTWFSLFQVSRMCGLF